MRRSRMRPGKRSTSGPAPRVAGHRSRGAPSGRKRIQVVVPKRDVILIKQLAERLRAPPAEAAAVRSALGAMVAPTVARTGKELIKLLRSAPLEGATLELKRDRRPATSDGFW
jgi:hypothetical protein